MATSVNGRQRRRRNLGRQPLAEEFRDTRKTSDTNQHSSTCSFPYSIITQHQAWRRRFIILGISSPMSYSSSISFCFGQCIIANTIYPRVENLAGADAFRSAGGIGGPISTHITRNLEYTVFLLYRYPQSSHEFTRRMLQGKEVIDKHPAT